MILLAIFSLHGLLHTCAKHKCQSVLDILHKCDRNLQEFTCCYTPALDFLNRSLYTMILTDAILQEQIEESVRSGGFKDACDADREAWKAVENALTGYQNICP